MCSSIWKTSAIGIGQRLFKILNGMEINIPGFHGLSQVTTQVQCVPWKGTNSPTMGHFVYRANDTSNCRKPPISRSLIQLKIISDLYYNPVQDGSGMDQWLDGGRENIEKACQILIMSAL